MSNKKFKICSICGQKYSIDHFDPIVKIRRGIKFLYNRNYCKFCRANKRVDYVNDNVDAFLAERFTKMKTSAKRKNITFSISKEEFIEQYYYQNGLCFYTDIPMICHFGDGKNRDSLSVDRIIPEKGYVKRNVVFACTKINIAKNDLTLEEIKLWMPFWYTRIVKMNIKNDILNVFKKYGLYGATSYTYPVAQDCAQDKDTKIKAALDEVRKKYNYPNDKIFSSAEVEAVNEYKLQGVSK